MDSRVALAGLAAAAGLGVGIVVGNLLSRGASTGTGSSATALSAPTPSDAPAAGTDAGARRHATRVEAAVERLEALVEKRDRADEIRRRSQQAMEAEMALLRRQLAVATAASRGEAKGHGGETEGGLPSPVNMRRQTSRLPDGGVVDLSPADMLRLRKIFSLFDEDNSGTIGHKEIKNLHRRLGEAITDAEATTALLQMNAVDGEVSFENFVRWWDNMHVKGAFGDRKGARYAARFKFLKAKLHNPETAVFYTRAVGSPELGDYRVNFYTKRSGHEVRVSPWHDVPLRTRDGTYNFVVEIPKWTRKKYEIATGEEYNPIKQDLDKAGNLREYKWGDMMFNYGAFPQTWEDPNEVSPHTLHKGDNDPIDAIELGGRSWPTGSIVEVKVLGVIALIDSGETDWKVLVINVQDPLARSMDDVADVRAHMPGAIEALTHWLRLYKSHDGVINQFAFDAECKGKDFAEEIVEETHGFWKRHPDNSAEA